MASAEAKICRKKYSIADHAHQRPKMLQRKDIKQTIDPHREHYFHGIKSTIVTKHLGCTPPSHAYHPALKDTPPPSFHRKSSPITENVLGACHVKRFDPSEPDGWFNRQATDVTEQLRFVPPAHACMGSSKPDPWYGRTRTYVTNPEVDDYTKFQVNIKAPPKKEKTEGGSNCPQPSIMDKDLHECPTLNEKGTS